MFEAFLGAFREVSRPAATSWGSPPQQGWSELMAAHGGATFDDGLYRLHTPDTSRQADDLVADAHPELRDEVRCFGFDWLGRQFAIDLRASQVESVRMIEPGTGQVLVLPASFVGFHDSLLLTFRDAALASDFFARWAAANRDALPLRPDRCVGYRVPLFLGGRDELDNLEESDLWVYLSISGQLFANTRGRTAGTPISGARIE